MTEHTRAVLHALLGRGDDAKDGVAAVLAAGLYGAQLARMTGLPNGTWFPILQRLVGHGWLERYWEDDERAEG